MSSERATVKVLLTLRADYVEALDALVGRGAASSRSELVEKIIGGFLSDLKERRQSESALGALVGFFVFLLGVAAIASIFGEGKR